MTTNYPASLDNFVNPAGTATLASPDQAKVGVDSSAVVTSLDFKVNNPISDNVSVILATQVFG
jgi:hypothetical protein